MGVILTCSKATAVAVVTDRLGVREPWARLVDSAMITVVVSSAFSARFQGSGGQFVRRAGEIVFDGHREFIVKELIISLYASILPPSPAGELLSAAAWRAIQSCRVPKKGQQVDYLLYCN